MELKDLEFKKDGTLTKATIRQIEESGEARNGTRSFNEVTGETMVVVPVGGVIVTYIEEGDTREKVEQVRSVDNPEQRAPETRSFDGQINEGEGE